MDFEGRRASTFYTTVPSEIYRDGQWVKNEKHVARRFAYDFIGLGDSGIVSVAAYNGADDDAYFAQFQMVVRRSTVLPGSNAPWYAQNASNLAQKRVDLELLAKSMFGLLRYSV
ncbi:MAG: hypothetical protein SGJ19_12715, partial [Planctomycetia bacterium]|nr:hypothetical protein [Planctomycetia bacterium]